MSESGGHVIPYIYTFTLVQRGSTMQLCRMKLRH